MKIKTIAAICKKSECLYLYDKTGSNGYVSQWVGDGMAIYPIVNIPYMETDNVCTIFEFTEKQLEKFLIRHTEVPEGICIDDTDRTEINLSNENLSIAYAGRILKPLQTSKGLVFIDSKYLSPLADIWNIMELYERTTQSGQTYIAAKAGFILYAVIMPYNALNETFVTQVEKLARQCRVAYDKKETARIAAAENEPQQQSIICDGKMVDTNTGEILEDIETEEQEENENADSGL
jgi:hypothetical protein